MRKSRQDRDIARPFAEEVLHFSCTFSWFVLCPYRVSIVHLKRRSNKFSVLLAAPAMFFWGVGTSNVGKAQGLQWSDGLRATAMAVGDSSEIQTTYWMSLSAVHVERTCFRTASRIFSLIDVGACGASCKEENATVRRSEAPPLSCFDPSDRVLSQLRVIPQGATICIPAIDAFLNSRRAARLADRVSEHLTCYKSCSTCSMSHTSDERDLVYKRFFLLNSRRCMRALIRQRQDAIGHINGLELWTRAVLH